MCSNYEEGYVGLARVISDLSQVHPEFVYGCVDVAFGVAVDAEGEEEEAFVVLFAEPNPKVRAYSLSLLFF